MAAFGMELSWQRDVLREKVDLLNLAALPVGLELGRFEGYNIPDSGGKATGFDVEFTEKKLSHSIIPAECSAEDCRPMMEGEARRHFPEGPLSVPKGPPRHREGGCCCV